MPGATLYYDVREAETKTTAPVLLMIGHPMDAQGFTTLAGHFRDRTVVTYDPRGTGRSEVTDRTQVRTPELHADDLHRLISALNAGPVDIFASSGGAINALALVAQHPEDVHTLVAHEPPIAPVLPDHEQAEAAIKDIRADVRARGLGAGDGEVHRFHQPARAGPGRLPAAAGAESSRFRAADRGRRLARRSTARRIARPDHALRSRLQCAASGAGPHRDRGRGRIRRHHGAARRARHRRAAQPGSCRCSPATTAGSLGGEFGYSGDPDAFAARLRQVLDEEGVRGADSGVLSKGSIARLRR